MQDQINYWNKTWEGRIEPNGRVLGNQKKFEKIMEFIWRRPQYFDLLKLEVGCGPCQHALQIAQYAPNYTNNWLGVDLSERAIQHASDQGINAACLDFLTWKPEKFRPFQCFTFWDSLEHFEDISAVADKMLELRAEKFMMQGNIPLYVSPLHEDGGVENHVDINMLRSLWEKLELPNQGYEVYGVYGFPYLMFEANNFEGG